MINTVDFRYFLGKTEMVDAHYWPMQPFFDYSMRSICGRQDFACHQLTQQRKCSNGSEACFLYADILNFEEKSTKNEGDTVGESARNRFGRPYISGRPLLTCDRKRIIEMHIKGVKKIKIAQELGVTHSCVSKVIRRFNETGVFEARNSRTASCACPGGASEHDVRICKHMRYRNYYCKPRRPAFTVDWILSDECKAVSKNKKHGNCRKQTFCWTSSK